MSTGIGAGISPVFELKPGGGVPAGCPKSRYSVEFEGNTGTQYLNNNTTALAIGGSGGTGSFSISFWLNWSTITTGDEQGVVLFGGGNDPKLQIYLNAASQSLLFNANNSSGGGSAYTHGTGNTIFPVIDTWYNFTFVMERTATTINTEWFKDGVSISTKSGAWPQVDNDLLFPASDNLYFGRRSSSSLEFLEGYLDDFSIWGQTLTSAEVIELMAVTTTNACMADLSFYSRIEHWWKMGDPNGPASYPTIQDAVASAPITLTMTNMSSANITTNVPV